MISYLNGLLKGSDAFTVFIRFHDGEEWDECAVLAVDAVGIVIDNDPLHTGNPGSAHAATWWSISTVIVVLS